MEDQGEPKKITALTAEDAKATFKTRCGQRAVMKGKISGRTFAGTCIGWLSCGGTGYLFFALDDGKTTDRYDVDDLESGYWGRSEDDGFDWHVEPGHRHVDAFGGGYVVEWVPQEVAG